MQEPGVCATTHIARRARVCGYAVWLAIAGLVSHIFSLPMQHFLKTSLPLFSVLALALPMSPAWADSTSSASSAASTSIGSSSTSVEKSSNSSSTKDKVAQGPYTVVEMAALAHQPDTLRLRLQAVAQGPRTGPSNEFILLLPRQAAERGHLAVGHVIAAEHRPYGIALATVTATGNTTPFFLVLDDAWFGELESRPLGV